MEMFMLFIPNTFAECVRLFLLLIITGCLSVPHQHIHIGKHVYVGEHTRKTYRTE